MVKKKIRLLVGLSILMLVFSWLLAIVTVITGNEELQQSRILEQAQNLLEDKLYMRAISKYQDAITNYTTDKNPEIENKILSLYKEAGKYDEYYRLIEDRISEEKAADWEYADLAQMYIDTGSIRKAIELLKNGTEKFDSEVLEDLYENIRYETKSVSSNILEMKQPASDWHVPYHNEELWGYVNDSAKLEIEEKYEEALPFPEDSKYTVVKLNGVYTLIDIQGDWYAVDKRGLDYVAGQAAGCIVAQKNGKFDLYTNTFSPITQENYDDAILSSNGLCFVKKNNKWGIITNEGATLIDFVYEDVVRNSHGEVFAEGYAVVKDESGYFIINEQGEELSSYRYTNAKGMEGSWIAVANKDGKWGFTNGLEETVIEYQYEDAYSMSCGVAAVKYAGEWGYISKRNKLVIEPQYEEALPFVKGEAIVKKMGLCKIIELQYYEYF